MKYIDYVKSNVLCFSVISGNNRDIPVIENIDLEKYVPINSRIVGIWVLAARVLRFGSLIFNFGKHKSSLLPGQQEEVSYENIFQNDLSISYSGSGVMVMSNVSLPFSPEIEENTFLTLNVVANSAKVRVGLNVHVILEESM